MSNRPKNILKLIQALKNSFSKELMKEIDYYLNDVEHEDSYDIADAFEDASNLAEEENPKMFDLMKPIYIEIGYAVPVDINTVVVSRGKRYWFKKDGIHYQCVSSWEEFINN